MFVQIDGRTVLQRSVILIVLIIGSNGNRNQFCNNLNHITNIFNLGPNVYVTQGLTLMWKFDTRSVKFNNVEKQTFGGIFGSDDFDSVDGVFSFAFPVCSASREKCVEPEAARNMLIATGERNGQKGYGYVIYKFNSNYSLSNVNKNWTHKWGLSAEGSLADDFWPKRFKQNGTLIIGTGFAANERNLYVAVNEFDDNKKPLYRLYTRYLKPDWIWSDWTDTDGEKINGMFTFRGDLYVVDSDSQIKTYKSSKAGSIEMKKSVSAKEFFNCAKNSTLLKFRSLNSNENDFSEYKESVDSGLKSTNSKATGNGADSVSEASVLSNKVSVAVSNGSPVDHSVHHSVVEPKEELFEPLVMPEERGVHMEPVGTPAQEIPSNINPDVASVPTNSEAIDRAPAQVFTEKTQKSFGPKLSSSGCLILFLVLFCFKI